MKKEIFITSGLILCTTNFLFGQNLVPNPSFEEYYSCPTYLYQLYRAKEWTINVNSADYYNGCATNASGVSVPNNGIGFQHPVSGDAYAGFLGKDIDVFGFDAREYLGTMLITPLSAGTKYYVSFYVSLNVASCFINKLGILFTNHFLGDTVILPAPLVNNFAQLHTDSLISDTLGWIKIFGSFVADSNYQYFMIGNFFDDAHVDSVLIQNEYCSAYYYIDDVCVSADSSVCWDLVSDIKSLFSPSSSIYPNPADGIIYLQGIQDNQVNLSIFNPVGHKIKLCNACPDSIDISDLPNGIYLMEINYRNQTFYKRQLIIH